MGRRETETGVGRDGDEEARSQSARHLLYKLALPALTSPVGIFISSLRLRSVKVLHPSLAAPSLTLRLLTLSISSRVRKIDLFFPLLFGVSSPATLNPLPSMAVHGSTFHKLTACEAIACERISYFSLLLTDRSRSRESEYSLENGEESFGEQ